VPTSAPTPAELAGRAAQGDRAAFAALHGRYAAMVHAVLLARLPRQECDDLVQEVFLAAWQGLGRLRTPDHVGAWLAGIARRRAAGHLRARRAPPDALPDGLPSGDPAPADGLGCDEILAELRALPEAYGETLALRLVEGLSGPEIAELTGLTPDSVRVNLSRGMARLRERLGRKGWP